MRASKEREILLVVTNATGLTAPPVRPRILSPRGSTQSGRLTVFQPRSLPVEHIAASDRQTTS